MEKDDLETIKSDLLHQLMFEHMNWDYFIETAGRAKKLAEDQNKNFLE